MGGYGLQNYENQEVLRIREQLGDFDYGDMPQGLGHREMREEVVIENNAKYTGEWIVGTNVRQG